LHFKHLTSEEIEGYEAGEATDADLQASAQALTRRLQHEDLQLKNYKHSGYKDFTEGPSADTPILLRQDAYKALTEPVTFTEADGSTAQTEHTARFGEIEQRFYATTPSGRALYDECLARAEAERAKAPKLVQQDYAAYQREYGKCFAPFPKTLTELLKQKLVYACYKVTAKGKAAGENGVVATDDINELAEQGYVCVEGLRYEDFLPISAAGIFASNLGQYGTKSTAAERPIYTKQTLEKIMGRTIVDTDALYQELEAESLRRIREELRPGKLMPV
jgi:uncharacterized glyoxalase superfamily metalloenzyme YdcJ